jgi:hypothetical protein
LTDGPRVLRLLSRTDVLFDRQPVPIDGRTSQKCETAMRNVAFNLDLQDVPALRRAVETSLAACDCRKEGRGSQCDACTALEHIHENLTRLLVRPLLRVPARPALAADGSTGAALAASGRSQFRVVPPIAADI